ncbi:hypothetical protein SOVF_114920 [Spinacia oleracea]|nr:hypothetical protein SOVF_114920 [Spinacia oleracea]
MLDFVNCPKTPIGVGDKKFMDVVRKGNEVVISDSCGEISVNFDRRVTRSFSRLMGRNVEVGKVSPSNQRGRNLIGVGDMKFIGVVGKGNEVDTSESYGEISLNLERRLTRSCSRLVGRNIEVGKISHSSQRGRNLFSHKGCESETRKVLGLLQSSAVRLGGEVKRISCNKGKENRSDSCKSLIGDPKTIGSGPLSHCVTRGGRRGRRSNLAGDHEKDGKKDDSCKQVEGSLGRRIIRRESIKVGGENDLPCQTMVRQNTRNSSTFVVGKAESIKARERKQEASGSFNYLETEPRKRIQCSSVLSACVIEGGNLDRRITRSASKKVGGENDLPRQTMVRRYSRNSSTLVVGKAESIKARERKQEGSGSFKYLETEPRKRIQCSPVLSSCVIEGGDRRITRSASKKVGRENDLPCETIVRRSTRKSSTRVAGKAESIKAREGKQEGSGSFKYLETEPRKRIQCSSVSSAFVVEGEKKAAKAIEAQENESDDCAEVDIPGRRDIKLSGVKRKRNQSGVQGPYKGWTEEQEVALRKAYFTAKPSPRFWKKVSKLVPGKSAQECFDKVHSENLTPVCTKTSSRAKKQNSPTDFLVSSSELFKSAETKSKKPCRKKCKSHVARKTVRQLLQKYCHAYQDNEADLFAVLEPSVNPSAEALELNAVQSTPNHFLRSPDSSSKSRDISSIGHKKHLSRFSLRSASPLSSPPVLKKVKNMALHEKYIDQLHIRDGKRKKSARHQKDGEENTVHMKDVIKAAKEALVSNAKDAINIFHQSQVNIMEACSDSEELLNSDNDEDETVL